MRLIILIFLIFYVNLSFGQETNEIEISADIMEWDKEKNQAVAIGNAKVIKGDTTILAEKITALIDNNSQKQQIKTLIASGDVKFYRDQELATGDSAIYNLSQDTVVLNGNVKLKRKDNVIKGDKLSIDFKTGLSKIEGSNSKKKVRMKYNTKELND